jgi:hypothetical protein
LIPNTLLKINNRYENWYDFKRDLESKLGVFLPVNVWLRIKPSKPLPWYDFDMQSIIKKIETYNDLRY